MANGEIMMKPLVANGFFVLMVATFFWGGNAIAGKLAVGHVSPMILTALRWVLAAIFLFPFAFSYLKQDRTIIVKLPLYFVLMGFVGFSFFNILLYSALTHTSALNVTIEQAAMPLFIFLINFIVFKQKPIKAQIIGYIITLLGVLITISGGKFEQILLLDFNQGDLIMMLAALAYASYSVGLAIKPAIHWLSFLWMLVFIAALASLPFAFYEMTTSAFLWPNSFLGWEIVCYTALLPSLLSQACFIRGVDLLGANMAGLFLNAVPIFGALLSVMILGEAFHLYHALALFLVIFGILYAQKKF